MIFIVFFYSGKHTPEGVSREVLSTLFMLAQVQSPPDAKHKAAENVNLLNLINNKVIEEQEHMKARQSVELSNQIMGKVFACTQRVSCVLFVGPDSNYTDPFPFLT